MNIHIIKIKEALNKAYLKLPPTRSQIETFKENFNYLFKHVKDSEGEEFHKNEISEFLKKTYYSPNHYINTRGRYDLVIHNCKDSTSCVGVIVECKSPGNVSDMPTKDNLNAKAILELILYFLRERITNKNLEIKHLIATNLYEWFIFDAHEFEKHFANNKFLVQKFIDFEEGRSSGKDTSFFYNSVAAAFLNTLDSEIKFTHLDLKDFERIVINSNEEDDNRLIPVYKIFSPEHLLKLQFKNDSNSLDKDFYRELLHIIGLEETKQGSKKLIGRAGDKTRNYGSLLESAISILKTEDKRF
jgi:adenine-specific DNA-methyltransferase